MNVARRFVDTDDVRMRVVEEGGVRDCASHRTRSKRGASQRWFGAKPPGPSAIGGCTAITPTRVMTDDLGDAILK